MTTQPKSPGAADAVATDLEALDAWAKETLFCEIRRLRKEIATRREQHEMAITQFEAVVANREGLWQGLVDETNELRVRVRQLESQISNTDAARREQSISADEHAVYAAVFSARLAMHADLRRVHDLANSSNHGLADFAKVGLIDLGDLAHAEAMAAVAVYRDTAARVAAAGKVTP